MKTTIWLLPLFGASFGAGCAGPLDQRWDRPVYLSIQDRFDHQDSQQASEQAQGGGQLPGSLGLFENFYLNDAIRIAIHNNPAMRVAGYRIDAASGRVQQAGLYPNPSIRFSAEGVGSGAGDGGETVYTVEQEIVLGGKLHKARDVASSRLQSARQGFVASEFAIATVVTQAYSAAVSAQHRLALREEIVSLTIQLRDATGARMQAGSVTKQDGLRAEVVYEQALLEQGKARHDLQVKMQILAYAIGIRMNDLDLELQPVEFLVMPSLDELQMLALESNSEISQARITIEHARRSYLLAKSQAIPNIVASVGPRYSDIDQESTVDFGLGIELPLFDRNQGEVRATLADRLSASTQLQAVQLRILSEVLQAFSTYQSASIDYYGYKDKIVPKAEQALGLATAAYESGKMSYFRLLDAQQVVIEARMAQVGSAEKVHNSIAILNELTHSNTSWRIAEINPELANEVIYK